MYEKSLYLKPQNGSTTYRSLSEIQKQCFTAKALAKQLKTNLFRKDCVERNRWWAYGFSIGIQAGNKGVENPELSINDYKNTNIQNSIHYR